MSLNDRDLAAQGTDVYPGVANPTISSNPTDPLAANDVVDVSEAPDSSGKRLKESTIAGGVVELRPGIIEATHIEPLDDTKAETQATGGITEKVNNAYTAVKESVVGK